MGLVLLVVITVFLANVVGLLATGLVRFPEPPPTVNIIHSHLNNRWSIHITSVSEKVPISEFRLIAFHRDATPVEYDTDADLIPDRRLVTGLDSLVVFSAYGPQLSPLVFVDTDADGNVSSGDFLLAYGPYYPPVAPLLDASRGYQEVDPAPGGIPRGSQLLIVASSLTLKGGTINPGDTVRVTLDKGGPFLVSREGVASGSGIFMTLVDVESTWVPATYMKTTFTIRPGEVDEWTEIVPFKVRMEAPITPSEREGYDAVTNPLGFGDEVALVHRSSNTIVLEVRL